MNDTCRRLCELPVLPEKSSGYDSWLGQTDLREFLEENARDDQVIICASVVFSPASFSPTALFAYSILVPATAVSPPEADDLLRWSVNRETARSVWDDGQNVRVESSLRDNPGKSLAKGEHLLFTRSLGGARELDHYVEISRKFSHLFGIHHMPERKAWCRTDGRGDMEDIVREARIAPSGECRCEGRVVLFSRDALAAYASLTETALVRMSDFDRFLTSKTPDWSEKKKL